VDWQQFLAQRPQFIQGDPGKAPVADALRQSLIPSGPPLDRIFVDINP
jgi:hypothetical protein